MLPRALAAGGAGARTEQPVASEHPSPAMVVDGHDSSAEGAMMALSVYDVTVGTTARPACVPREHHRLRAMGPAARPRWTRRTACSGSARRAAGIDGSHATILLLATFAVAIHRETHRERERVLPLPQKRNTQQARGNTGFHSTKEAVGY